MYSHIQVGAREPARMAAFYDRVLAELGLVRVPQTATDDVAGLIWSRPAQRWPQFVVRRPVNGLPATWGNGCQISFAAPSPLEVASAWSVALICGGTDEGVPGIRAIYAYDFYAAYCRDPEGNKIAFIHAEGLIV